MKLFLQLGVSIRSATTAVATQPECSLCYPPPDVVVSVGNGDGSKRSRRNPIPEIRSAQSYHL